MNALGSSGGFRWWFLIPVFVIGGLASYYIFSQTDVLRSTGTETAPAGIPSVQTSTETPGLASQSPSSGGPKVVDRRPESPDGVTTSLEIDQGRETALVRASRRAGPAVVSINVMQTRYYRYNPFADRNPMESFFRGIVPGQVYREEIPGLGSGVIVSEDGVVLTNEHVVHDAEQIKVTLSDGRVFDGVLVGADANYDLAVVKIEGEDLPVAAVGNSDDLMVGEWVVAIGNPFGFLLNDNQPTVTAGVVSAVHRDIRPSDNVHGIFKDMIQTDASINPGNSGGPLVNSLGEVVGVNTFIFTQSGGSLGIGFAIPIDTGLEVLQEILQFGRVRTPWLGIKVQAISPYLAAYFQIRDRRGLLVWTLEEGSPADEAGIQVGDIIRKVNGETVVTAQEAQRLSFGAQIGDEITLTIERNGQLLDVNVILTEEPARD